MVPFKIRMTWPQAKKCQEPLETEKDKDVYKGSVSPPTPCLQTSGFQHYEGINCCCCKTPVCDNITATMGD